MIQGVLLGVLLASGPGSQVSVTYETRIDEDGRLVCALAGVETGTVAPRPDPSSQDHLESNDSWWVDPPDHTVREGNIEIGFYNFPSDEFREAFRHAAAIFDSILDIKVPVQIKTVYLPLTHPANPAGQTSISITCESGPFCRTRVLENQVQGVDTNGERDEAKIHIFDLEGSYPYPGGWHLEKDWSPPPDKIDLITTVLHELTHAFGFVSGFNRSGCCEARSHAEDDPFTVYDLFVWTQENGRLIDLPSPSEELLEALSGPQLFWGQTGWKNVRGEPMLTPEVAMGPVWLMSAWSTYVVYLHVSHLDGRAYPKGTVNSLMGVAYSGVALRHPGPIITAMLYDMGWDLKTEIPTDLPPPPPWKDPPPLPPPPPPPPPTEPPPMPDVQLTVTQRGGWYQLLLRWDPLPTAEYYYSSIRSPSRKHRYHALRKYHPQPEARYLVRKSWGPFTIWVEGVNDLGSGPRAVLTWPEE